MSKLPPKRKECVVDKIHQVWKTNPTMEKDFIDLCLQSVALHRYKGSSLYSWATVIAELNKKYDQNFDQKTLKNKWSALKAAYLVWRSLIQRTGGDRNEDGTFNWDDATWEAEIQRDKKCAKYRLAPLPNFKEMEELFEGTFVVGDQAKLPYPDPIDHCTVDVDAFADVLPNEAYVDLSADAFFSTTREASPTTPKEASPCVGTSQVKPIESTQTGSTQTGSTHRFYLNHHIIWALNYYCNSCLGYLQ